MTDVSGSGFDLARPDPAGTIQSLTSLGYTPAAAIADLIDNSIAAGARTVEVSIHWDGADGSTVAVCDDGAGMDTGALIRAMTVGAGGTADRAANDLGRFGMGLKTASFSQSREVTVATRPAADRDWLTRTWDVDHVLRVGDWQLLRDVPPEARPALQRSLRAQRGPGTVVMWRRLTRLAAKASTAGDDRAHREFLRQIEVIEKHLSMVFGRYLTRRNRLRLTVNGNPLTAWDPFLGGNTYVRQLAPETPLGGVEIRGFILPHHIRMSTAEHDAAGGPAGWLEQQGFYVYRRDRLIVAGGWLGLKGMRRDARHQLARVSIEMDTAHDQQWGVDVRKATATPPPALIGHLQRIATHAREQAAAVLAHRGGIVTTRRSVPIDPMWREVSLHGRTHFAISRQHPLVQAARSNPDARGPVSALLRMIEQTVPLGLIQHTPDAEITAPDAGAPQAATVAMARMTLDALLREDGPVRAMERLVAMPPFDNYPGLRQILTAGPVGAAAPADGASELLKETWSND